MSGVGYVVATASPAALIGLGFFCGVVFMASLVCVVIWHGERADRGMRL